MLNPTSPQRLAFGLLRQQTMQLAAAALWRAAFVLVPMQVPVLTGVIVDGLTGKPTRLYGWPLAGSPHQVLSIAVVGLLLVAIAYGVSAWGQMLSSGKLSRRFVCELRRKLTEAIARMSLAQHQSYGAGDLIDRTISDTAETRRFVERVFIQTLTNVVRVGCPIAMMFCTDPLLAVVALSILPPQVLISRWLQRQLHAATRSSRRSQSDLTSAAKETYDGVETIKALGAEAAAAQRLQDGALQLEQDELNAHAMTGLINGNVWLMTSVGVALTWWLG
ncbi:MAG: ABC transporter ATP-binding protein, partial [Planctomycetales bacterium]|nr:ABC transporter ATP-binding protein [Planctomycetales bacterium]